MVQLQLQLQLLKFFFMLLGLNYWIEVHKVEQHFFSEVKFSLHEFGISASRTMLLCQEVFGLRRSGFGLNQAWSETYLQTRPSIAEIK